MSKLNLHSIADVVRYAVKNRLTELSAQRFAGTIHRYSFREK